jgi:hypothetical protein
MVLSNRLNIFLLPFANPKLYEHFDREIFDVSGVVSGHTLKHLAAAAGIYVLLVSFGRRRLV